MKFLYEDKFTAVLALIGFSAIAYILSGSILITSSVAFAVIVIYKLGARRFVEFKDDVVVIRDNALSKNRYAIKYADIHKVHFEQVYSTVYINILATVRFNVLGVEKKTGFEIKDNNNVVRLVMLLKTKNVSYSYSDDYVETIIEHAVNTK